MEYVSIYQGERRRRRKKRRKQSPETIKKRLETRARRKIENEKRRRFVLGLPMEDIDPKTTIIKRLTKPGT